MAERTPLAGGLSSSWWNSQVLYYKNTLPPKKSNIYNHTLLLVGNAGTYLMENPFVQESGNILKNILKVGSGASLSPRLTSAPPYPHPGVKHLHDISLLWTAERILFSGEKSHARGYNPFPPAAFMQ